MRTVRMVQCTPHLWRIENMQGKAIQEGITAHSVYEAEEFVKKFISSFRNWTYIIVKLGDQQ